MGYYRSYRSYYGGRRAAPKVRDYKKDISRLERISDLEIKDLKKLREYLTSYPIKCKQITEENAKTESENLRRHRINKERRSDWERQQQQINATHTATYIAPINAQIGRLVGELEGYKVSFLGGLIASNIVESSVLGYRTKYKGGKAQEIIKAIESLYHQRSVAEASRPQVPEPAELAILPSKKIPNEYTVLTISGLKTRVFFSDFDVDDVNQLIEEREAEISKKEAKVKEIKARADRNEAAVRNQAKPYLRGLSVQLKKLECCPYCGGQLNRSNFHQDHIHPVSKGGLSIPANLVFVCVSCNIKKRDKSLARFVREEGFDFEVVFDRLDLLGKH